MKTIKRREDIYTFEEEGVRSFLLLGRERALAVDSGFGTFDLQEAVRAVTQLPFVYLNTHCDGDHTGGNGVFRDVYAYEAEIPLLKERRPEDLAEYHPVRDGDVFDLGGVTWKVIHCPGHTPGSLALFDEAGRTLVTGDTVSEASVYMFGGARSHQDYKETLNMLGSRYGGLVDTILPSHGECPLTGLHELTEDLLAALGRFECGLAEDELVELRSGVTVKLYRHGRGAVLAEEL